MIAVGPIVGTVSEWLFSLVVFMFVIGFLLHCPIVKPWFGFRRPPGHNGRWFE